MEVDPARVRLVACWLRKAHNDLRAARWGLVADPPLVEDVAFHAQQAVEKAEKGLLVWHGVVFRKTHDLDELADQVLPLDPSLSSQHQSKACTPHSTNTTNRKSQYISSHTHINTAEP